MMATKTVNEANKWIFLWKIENISSTWMKMGEVIKSPVFITDALECTKWSLNLYPMGSINEDYIGIFLYREMDLHGPAEIFVNFQFAFLGKDGSYLKEITTYDTFQRPKRWGRTEFEKRVKVFNHERAEFLPDDTLTVQCTVWKKEDMPVKPEHFCTRTVFKTNRRSFLWKIHEFSTLKTSLGKKWKDSLIEFDLVLNEEADFERKSILNVNSFNESVRCFCLETSVVDSEGNKENCGTHKYSVDDLKKGILSSMPILTKKWLENKSRYLPNDVLSLECDMGILCQIDFYDFFNSELTFSSLAHEEVESRNEHFTDMKSMYNDAIFSDVELRTPTKTFPAHRNILSARSPVFRRMFSLDMKEKNCGYVDIDDMDDDTMRRMLVYLYTVSIEDLQFESASKLYAAADKYGILSLKRRCSSFLKENLCPTKACEVFLLADQHQDTDLKCFVQDYMLEHDEEVFGSSEWTDFIDTHPTVAGHLMQRKYVPTVLEMRK